MTKDAKRLIKFAVAYPGWHTYGTDRSTVKALRQAQELDVIEISTTRQFRLALPSWAIEKLEK